MTYIITWRTIGKSIALDQLKTTGSWEQVPKNYELSNRYRKSSKLFKLLSHIMAIQVEQGIEEKAHASGYQNGRVDSNMIEIVLKTLRLPSTREEKKKLQNWLSFPRKWKKVLGRHCGLLPFIPLEGSDMVNEYLQLSAAEVKTFQLLLSDDKVTTLNQIGLSFQNSILTGQGVPDMVWETIDFKELENLPAERLVQLLGESVVQTPD